MRGSCKGSAGHEQAQERGREAPLAGLVCRCPLDIIAWSPEELDGVFFKAGSLDTVSVVAVECDVHVDDGKLVVANSVEEAVVPLSFKVTELLSLQEPLF